ncbi:MAG TPA: BMP family ABC transporter substrate-binding protein [Candidatus Xenobia bacterium]|jgi:basic membrane protein A
MKAYAWLVLPLFWGTILFTGCTQQPYEGSASTGFINPPSNGKLRIAIVTDKGGLGDQSFNDSAYQGLKQAEAELGIDPTVMQSKEEADFEKNLRTCAQAHFDLTIAVGIALTDAVKSVAGQYPDVKFGLVDGTVDGMKNVTCLTFKEEEGSFLVGALAGMMTKSNKTSFIGGRAIPLILKFASGYEAGVEEVNPKATTIEGFTGKWDDPGLGKEMADAQYAQGIDIIYAAAGACNQGVIEASKEKGPGFWSIGVDSDEDFLGTADPTNPAPPGRCLTSMVKHVDLAVFNTIRDLKAGQFHPGKVTFGLKEGGVSLSDMKYTRQDVPPADLTRIEQLKADIIAGKIKVPTSHDELKAFKP